VYDRFGLSLGLGKLVGPVVDDVRALWPGGAGFGRGVASVMARDDRDVDISILARV
jgi:hypothetical protein